MRKERIKIVEDNEKHIQEEEERRKKKEGDDSDEGDEDGFVDDDEDEDSDHGSDDEQATLAKIAKLRKQGKTLEGAGDDLGDEDEDDEDDEDYEYTAGDLAIYDSALDDVDELLHIRAALERLNAQDSAYASQLLSAMDPETLQKFNTNMNEAQALKDREEVVRKRCDELDEKHPPGSTMV